VDSPCSGPLIKVESQTDKSTNANSPQSDSVFSAFGTNRPFKDNQSRLPEDMTHSQSHGETAFPSTPISVKGTKNVLIDQWTNLRGIE